MLPRTRSAIMVAAAGLLAFGCSHYEMPAFNVPDGANGSELLIVPFRETLRRGRRTWYAESPRGLCLADNIMTWACGEADDAIFAEGPTVEQVVNTVRDDDTWLLKGTITGRDWRKLAGGLGVKYVLVGDIEKFSLRKSGTIGLYKPSAKVTYEVFDAVRGRRAFKNTLNVTDPGGGNVPMMDLTSFHSDDTVEARLLAEMAKMIGKELYGYYDEGG